MFRWADRPALWADAANVAGEGVAAIKALVVCGTLGANPPLACDDNANGAQPGTDHSAREVFSLLPPR